MEIYHGNALTASDLNHDTKLKLVGDITGEVTFGYDKNSLSLTTSASDIISSTAEANKALKLDGNKVLQAKSSSAEKLDHNLTINLTDAVTGSVTWDTSTNSVSIKTTVADTNVLKKSDIGTILADLDNNKKIKDIYLPDQSKGGFKIVGLWSGSTAPNTNPQENTAYVVTNDCTFSGMNFKKGDWIYYYNSSWNRADVSNGIHSVNNYTGNAITLDYDDVNAISDTYIDYTVGATIPKTKIPITDKDGHLAGVTVDKLTKEFSLLTASNGDIKIDTANSTRVKTDGSQDLDTKLIITEDGYTNIANKLRRDIYVNGSKKQFAKNLNFIGDITASSSPSELSLDFTEMSKDIVYFSGTLTNDFKTKVLDRIDLKDSRPFYIAFMNNDRIHFASVNSSTASSGTVTIPSDECTIVKNGDKFDVKTSSIKMVFNSSGGDITSCSVVANSITVDNINMATKLKTARKINDTTFDGTADITTTKWGTARNIGIINSDGTGTAATVSVNGSANTNLKLPESSKFKNVQATDRVTTNALTVNGKKIFIQSGTPSGASNGDIWIVTK